MTQMQMATIEQLLSVGWEVVPNPQPSVRGGPVVIKDAGGNLHTVNPDGSLTPYQDS